MSAQDGGPAIDWALLALKFVGVFLVAFFATTLANRSRK